MSVDFSFITTRLATGGGIADAADVDALVNAGVTAIIDCRAEQDDAPLLAGRSEVAYLWNPTADDGQHKTTEWFQKSIEFALGQLIHPSKIVYAHCAAGINRGPSTAYAIMRALGWGPIEALGLIHLRRPVTLGGVRYSSDADSAVKVLGYGGLL